MALTIEDIAKLSGTSKSTVSRYLNEGSVSKKTAQKIKRIIEETGFEMNISASRLKRKKSNLVGVLFEGFGSNSVQQMLSGINRQLKDSGYLPFIILDEVGAENRMNNVKALVNQGVDGIIYGAGSFTAEHIQYLSKVDVPVILIGQENEYIPYRKIDDFKAGFLLGEVLSKNKYEKICLLTWSETDKAVGIERRNGFLKGIKSINPPGQILTIESTYDMHENYLIAETVLKENPDLIVGSTDRMIMGVIEYLNEHKISIPNTVSVAGFGNYEYGKALYPPLTSVQLDYSSLGMDTAKSIVQLISGDKIDHMSKDYNVEVIERGSTK